MRRHADDHLSLVTGISRLQTRELEANGIKTLAKLGSLPRLPFTPSRGANETYERIRAQARVQLEGRNRKQPYHELLPVELGQGLTCLPVPSKGDVFLALEGRTFLPAPLVLNYRDRVSEGDAQANAFSHRKLDVPFASLAISVVPVRTLHSPIVYKKRWFARCCQSSAKSEAFYGDESVVDRARQC
jgi:hypothetical protein